GLSGLNVSRTNRLLLSTEPFSTVRTLAHARSVDLVGSLGQLAERIDDDAWGQQFGQEVGFAPARRVERVSRHAAAAQRGERLGDGFVVAGPVGLEQGDVAVCKRLLHLRLVESHALVELAAQAPTGGEVHKDRATFGLIAADGLGGPGFPLVSGSLSGNG